MIDNEILKETEYLFNCDFYSSDFDKNEHEYEHLDRAEELFKKYSWDVIFKYWEQYFDDNCISPEKVINFANLYFYYGASEFPIPDPIRFAAKFYKKANLDENAEDALTILDSIFIPLFSKMGLINLSKEPNYVPDKDPRILAEIDSL